MMEIPITVYYYDDNQISISETIVDIPVYDGDDDLDVIERVTNKAVLWASDNGYEYDNWDMMPEDSLDFYNKTGIEI